MDHRHLIQNLKEHQRRALDQTRLAAIVESSQDAIIGNTLEGIIDSWNLAAARLYGYSLDEVIGKSITMLFPNEFPEEFIRIHTRVSKGTRIDNYETLRMRKDGRLIRVSVTISPIKDRSGTTVGISTIERRLMDHPGQTNELPVSVGSIG